MIFLFICFFSRKAYEYRFILKWLKLVLTLYFNFSGFFPVAINFLRRVPVLGTILNFPGISAVCKEKIIKIEL